MLLINSSHANHSIIIMFGMVELGLNPREVSEKFCILRSRSLVIPLYRLTQQLYLVSLNNCTSSHSTTVHRLTQQLYIVSLNKCTSSHATTVHPVHRLTQQLYIISLNNCTSSHSTTVHLLTQQLYIVSLNNCTSSHATTVHPVHRLTQQLYIVSLNNCASSHSPTVCLFFVSTPLIPSMIKYCVRKTLEMSRKIQLSWNFWKYSNNVRNTGNYNPTFKYQFNFHTFSL